MIKQEIKGKWSQQCKEKGLPSYDKSLKNELKPYIEYCTRFAWRIVTQVPPLKIDYKSTTYNPASHNESQAFSSSASQHPPERWPVCRNVLKWLNVTYGPHYMILMAG